MAITMSLQSQITQLFSSIIPRWPGRSRATGGASHIYLDSGLRTGLIPGTNYNFRQAVGDPLTNSAVSSAVGWIAQQFSEPEFVIYSHDDGNKSIVFDHPLTELINKPNAYYSSSQLWSMTVYSYLVHGNAYWLKVRDKINRITSLVHLSPTAVEPYWTSSDQWVEGYRYTVDQSSVIYDPQDIIHFADRLDERTRKGISRLAPAIREIALDNELSNFTASILRNMGIPSVLISPREKINFSREQQENFKSFWRNSFSGDARGEPMIPILPVDVKKLSITPQELSVDSMRNIPEDRVCACLHISPLVVGLTSGAAHKTYANYTEARSAAYEDCIVPLQTEFCRTLDASLMSEFPTKASSETHCGWDYSQVPCMQEDVDTKNDRILSQLQAGVISIPEARALLGYPEIPNL